SRGCIRLYPEDIERLFNSVSVGTPVTVVDQPVKLGWHHGQLYIEVHPNRSQLDQLEAEYRMDPAHPYDVVDDVLEAAGDQAHRIDWEAVRLAERQRRGIPVPIMQPPALPEPPSLLPQARMVNEQRG